MMYKHKRLREVKTMQFYPNGKRMFVWDNWDETPRVATVYAVALFPIMEKTGEPMPYPVLTDSHPFAHCAPIPKELENEDSN